MKRTRVHKKQTDNQTGKYVRINSVTDRHRKPQLPNHETTRKQTCGTRADAQVHACAHETKRPCSHSLHLTSLNPKPPTRSSAVYPG